MPFITNDCYTFL